MGMGCENTCNDKLPDRRRCLDLLAAEGVPGHICAHSERVAEVALRLARPLMGVAGETLDIKLVEAGALLHDISKFFTIQNGGNHCTIGGARARELGLCAIVPIIERHVDLGEWDPQGPVTEVELINYADKRVCHTEVVTLAERFDDLLHRYGKTQKARTRITGNWDVIKKLEEKIMGRIPVVNRF
jgi:uncharacterized protein